MPEIHSTSIIDSTVNLADDVTIGPNCIIEGKVDIASSTQLVANVHLRGPLKIGENNTIYPYSCIGFPPQDRKFSPDDTTNGIIIGNNNILRESVTIHGATEDSPTTVGDGNYFMINTHLGHDVKLEDNCMLANGVAIAGHVDIASNVVFGGNAVVQQFCRVGRIAMLSGVMGITRDLPPFCLVYNSRHVSSLNIIGLRRAGLGKSISALKKAFNILFKRRLNNTRAIETIESELSYDPLCMELAQFVKKSKVGICTYSNHNKD